MRNLGIFLLIAGLAFACGDDDDPPPPPPVIEDFSAYINSGGPAVTLSGTDWVADKDNDASEMYENVVDIEGTEDDALYQTEVFDQAAFTYNIAVPGEATLDVTLHFAEIYHGVENAQGVGARVFDVDVEGGQGTLTNYDIIEQAGAAQTAVTATFDDVEVTDGSLTITFTTVVDAAKVNAVEVSGTYEVP